MPWFCLKHWIPSHINEGQTERDISTFFADARTNVCVCVCVLFAQLCPSLCEPMDCRLLGSSAHGILQARILEWVAIPFSRGSSQPRDQTQVSCIEGRFFTVWATRVGKINDVFLGSCPVFCPPDLSDYWRGFWHWYITTGNRSGGQLQT